MTYRTSAARLTPKDLSFADSVPWRFDMVGDVDAPVDRVWATFIDNPSWANWFDGCTSCESTSSPADGIGSTRTIRVRPARRSENGCPFTALGTWNLDELVRHAEQVVGAASPQIAG
jgi:hypothetical protein